MAQSNQESDDLTRKESAKQLEANNNTDNGENNNNDGEEGGESSQKVNNKSAQYLTIWSISPVKLLFKFVIVLRFFIIQKLPYPKSILFIVGNEFCERFSYYGMKGKNIYYQKTF